MSSPLTPFFHPRGVVVVALLHHLKSWATAQRVTCLQRLQRRDPLRGPENGYAVQTSAVHRPVAGAGPGRPGGADRAAPATPETLEACGQRGIHAPLWSRPGSARPGRRRAALEAKCLEVARRHDIRMVRANCIGTPGQHLPCSIPPSWPRPCRQGHIGFVSTPEPSAPRSSTGRGSMASASRA